MRYPINRQVNVHGFFGVIVTGMNGDGGENYPIYAVKLNGKPWIHWCTEDEIEANGSCHRCSPPCMPCIYPNDESPWCPDCGAARSKS